MSDYERRGNIFLVPEECEGGGFKYTPLPATTVFDVIFESLSVEEAFILNQQGYDIDLADGEIKSITWR